MLKDLQLDHVYIACGYTDLRLGIDGLADLVQLHFELDPYTNTLYIPIHCSYSVDVDATE